MVGGFLVGNWIWLGLNKNELLVLSSASLAEAEADLWWRSNHENYDSVVQTTCYNVI